MTDSARPPCWLPVKLTRLEVGRLARTAPAPALVVRERPLGDVTPGLRGSVICGWARLLIGMAPRAQVSITGAWRVPGNDTQ